MDQIRNNIANKYDFGKYNSQEKLRTLISNFESFKRSDADVSLALSLCSDAWHLTDFIFEEYKNELKLNTLGGFRESLFFKCEHLKIVHDLANASKHKIISRPKAEIKMTERHIGAFSNGFSRAFDISHLVIELDNNRLDFYDIMNDVIEFWKVFFRENFNEKI